MSSQPLGRVADLLPGRPTEGDARRHVPTARRRLQPPLAASWRCVPIAPGFCAIRHARLAGSPIAAPLPGPARPSGTGPRRFATWAAPARIHPPPPAP